MAVIDTTNWVYNRTLDDINTTALQAYAGNVNNAYTLVESSSEEFVSNDFDSSNQGSGNFNPHYANRYRFDWKPLLRTPTETSSGALFSYDSSSKGKSVRPPQHLTWESAGGHHIHMIPVIRQLNVRYVKSPLQNSLWWAEPQLVMDFYYASTTTEFAFPNFNDAGFEIDCSIFRADDDTKWIEIENFPIGTTGAPSTVVINTSDPQDNVLRRDTFGVARIKGYGTTHIPGSNEISGSNSDFHGERRDVFGGGFNVAFPANRPNKLVIAYRIHSQAAPYTRINVPRISNPINQLNPGIYHNNPSFDIEGEVEDSVNLRGVVTANYVENVPNSYQAQLTDTVRLTANISPLYNENTSITYAGEVEGRVRLSESIHADFRTDSDVPRTYESHVTASVRLEGHVNPERHVAYNATVVGRIGLTGGVDESHRFGPKPVGSIGLYSDITTRKNDLATGQVSAILALEQGLVQGIGGYDEEEGRPNDGSGSASGAFIVVTGRKLFRNMVR